MKNPKLTMVSRFGLVVLLTVTLSGCVNLEVLSKKCAGTTVKTNGEDDYAIKCTVQARNKGAAGKIRAKLKLNTSEGQFYQEQVTTMASDEVKSFEFLFTEVTITTLFNDGDDSYEFSYESVK